ncbi:hypothetical protein [Komagataeibacter medellinensis]|uniref:Uncharacterized protein n=1 Tax=Komagataeibacter medellinensis (strain NBRC 3288 / BCRC 11682 / LMG 1693 / Kondo 51) TaxID=634177 RepID=G2I0W5_KOMMN|nr:hypothetical protein [Komagataeibacter medellinensis]BAK84573.1 hypothetical protein GLX_21610 [Komagataeibacter medellinensis NBRC 3288]
MPIAPYDPKNDPVQIYRRHGSGPIYRAVGLITDPAVILEDVATGQQHTVVIRSLIAKDYVRLIDEPGETS